MEFSEACDQLVEEIQKRELYPFQYSLMIMTFIEAKDDDETNQQDTFKPMMEKPK